jgi:hypothetical protein
MAKKKNKKQKTIIYKGYTCKLVDKWVAPEEGGAPILTMPNIPHPLHGKGYQPRTVLGASTWNHMRNRCYYEAGYKCEICGAKVKTEYNDDGTIKHKYHSDGTILKRQLHSHELFNIDYNKGEAHFVRCIAACERCHVRFIHSGRMLTLFKNGDPLMTASRVIDGIEAGFKQIKEWNDNHRGEEKLRVYYSIIDYVSNPIIGDKVKELIDKYDIEFYLPDGEKYRMGKPVWGEWSVFICNKEYKSKYQSQKDWEKAMEENNKEQVKKNLSWAIKVGAIDKNQLNDDIEKILNTDDAAEKLASF